MRAHVPFDGGSGMANNHQINIDPRLIYGIALAGVANQPHQDSGSLSDEVFMKLIMTAMGRWTNLVVMKMEA